MTAAGPVRTVFFGSGGFAVPILDVLAREPRVRMVGVITAPDRPAGRGNQLTATPVAITVRDSVNATVTATLTVNPSATLAVQPATADVFSGVPATLTIVGGAPPYTAFSSNQDAGGGIAPAATSRCARSTSAAFLVSGLLTSRDDKLRASDPKRSARSGAAWA